MPSTLIKVDLTESPYKNDMIHNRWHPDIPMVAWVKPGDDFIVDAVVNSGPCVTSVGH
jgi:formamidase